MIFQSSSSRNAPKKSLKISHDVKMKRKKFKKDFALSENVFALYLLRQFLLKSL